MTRIFCVLCLTSILCSPTSLVYADKIPKKITVATWNVEWFYDSYLGDNSSDLSKRQSAPSQAEWDWKLDNVARVIAKMNPTILALQEIENRQVIRKLTKKLSDQHQLKYRIAYIEGWDNFTEQDVAVIYQSGLVEYSRREQSFEMFTSKQFYNLNKHLFAKFEWGDGEEKESLTLLTVHLRAMPEKHDLRQKQCRLIRNWIEDKIAKQENVIVLGDFNSEEMTHAVAKGSDLSILGGWNNESTADDLVDLNQFLPADRRDTHIGGKHYDRILVSPAMTKDDKKTKDLMFSQIANFKDLVIVNGKDDDHFNKYYDIPRDRRDFSDHYPVMSEFIFK